MNKNFANLGNYTFRQKVAIISHRIKKWKLVKRKFCKVGIVPKTTRQTEKNMIYHISYSGNRLARLIFHNGLQSFRDTISKFE